MPCRFCDDPTKKLIEAHVIPKGFFRRMNDGSGSILLLSTDDKKYPKRTPVGPYDSSILCENCEPLFGPWDDYAQAILQFEPEGAMKHSWAGTTFGLEIAQYNYELLKLFFISLLWRAAVSSNQCYDDIQIGPFEDRLKEMLQAGDPGDPECFAVVLAKFDDPLSLATPMPCRRIIDDLNYCIFYMGGFQAYIKVDTRPSLPDFSPVLLRPNASLKIVSREWSGSAEHKLAFMLSTAPNNKRFAKPRPGRKGIQS